MAVPGLRRAWRRFPLGSAVLRTEYDIWQHPAYAYGVLCAARQAKMLGHGSICVLEFGVAGGNGLVTLERIANDIGRELDIAIEVAGFDGGTGMPAPQDYRDLPSVWGAGFYPMDRKLLEARLKTAKLIIGPISETLPNFLATSIARLGFIAFDLDYYSSTRTALKIFGCAEDKRLPRVHCYFDDTIEPEWAGHSSFTGELAAIKEFNSQSDNKKITRVHGLSWLRRKPAMWNDKIFIFHDFAHSEYCTLLTPEGSSHRELPLTPPYQRT